MSIACCFPWRKGGRKGNDLVSSQSILVSVSRTDDYRPKSRPRDLEIETSVNGERDSSAVRASDS